MVDQEREQFEIAFAAKMGIDLATVRSLWNEQLQTYLGKGILNVALEAAWWGWREKSKQQRTAMR